MTLSRVDEPRTCFPKTCQPLIYPTYCGWTTSCTTKRPWQIIIIIPLGFIGGATWISSAHSIAMSDPPKKGAWLPFGFPLQPCLEDIIFVSPIFPDHSSWYGSLGSGIGQGMVPLPTRYSKSYWAHPNDPPNGQVDPRTGEIIKADIRMGEGRVTPPSRVAKEGVGSIHLWLPVGLKESERIHHGPSKLPSKKRLLPSKFPRKVRMALNYGLNSCCHG